MTAAPEPAPMTCAVCGIPVGADSERCPSCGLTRPAARGAQVLGRNGLWVLAGAFVVVYLIVLLIVATAN